MSQEINLGKYLDQMVEVVLRDGSSYAGLIYKKDPPYGGDFPYLFGGYSYTEDGRCHFLAANGMNDIVCVYVLERSATPLTGIVQFAPHIDLAVFNGGDEVYFETESNYKRLGIVGEYTANNRRKISLSENFQAYCRLDGSDGLESPIISIYGPGAYRLDLAPAPDPAVISVLNTLNSLSPDQLSQVLSYFNQQ